MDALLAGSLLALLTAADWPAPAPPAAPVANGEIQRSLRLMADSTPTRRNTVRVLFYGQSITQQTWWKEVADYLRATYPHADLRIENKAIGGFAAQLLVKTAEADLYPAYPDLVIFHVYGSHIEYENIIKRLRERTTADLLIANDHPTKPEDLVEETDPAKLAPNGQVWSAFMNHKFLPETAAKYHAAYADIRAPWKAYLQANGLDPKALLKDSVHLNDQGCYLMAELLKPYLVRRPDAPDHPDPAWRDTVRAYRVGDDVDWHHGTLTLAFEGNRVDLIAAPGARPTAPANVMIDGRRPSETAGCFAATRVKGWPQVGWPCLKRVMHQQPWVAEDWTIRIGEHDDALKDFTFRVEGSVTGADGQGRCTETFVSPSGRVVIEPDDWMVARSREYTNVPLPDGFEITWRTYLMGADTYLAPEIADPAVEQVTTLAQGLVNGPHTLTLTAGADGPPPLAAIRVYRPPLR